MNNIQQLFIKTCFLKIIMQIRYHLIVMNVIC